MTIERSVDHWDLLEADGIDVYDVGIVIKGDHDQVKEFLKKLFHTRSGFPPNRIEDHYSTDIILSFYENLKDESSKKYMIWASALSKEEKEEPVEYIEYIERTGEIEFHDLTRR